MAEKSRPNLIESCVYCGQAAQTRDHVPPKSIFPKSLRKNLITVPACETCNNSSKLDDEYFRAVVTMASEDPNAVSVWKQGVFKRASPAFRSRLLNSLRPAELRSPAGLHLRYGHSLKLENTRIKGVVIRIVRGLLWHHHQVSTCLDTTFDICLNPEPGMIHETLHVLPVRSVGDTTFQYRYGIASDDPQSSVWWLRFYQSTQFLVFATGKAGLELEAHMNTS